MTRLLITVAFVTVAAPVALAADKEDPRFRSWADAGVGSHSAIRVTLHYLKREPFVVHLKLVKLDKKFGELESWATKADGKTPTGSMPTKDRIAAYPTVQFQGRQPIRVFTDDDNDPDIKVTRSKEVLTIKGVKFECAKKVSAYKGGKTETEWFSPSVPGYIVQKKVVSNQGELLETWELIDWKTNKQK